MTTPFTTISDHFRMQARPTHHQRPPTPITPQLHFRQTASTLAATLLSLSLSSSPPPALAAATQPRDPPAIFATTCAGCHAAGGNIVRPNATLQLADLEKYGLADTAALYDIIYSGKNSMPGYGINCTPKGACTFGARFSDEEVEGVAKYVLDEAKNGWKVGEK